MEQMTKIGREYDTVVASYGLRYKLGWNMAIIPGVNSWSLVPLVSQIAIQKHWSLSCAKKIKFIFPSYNNSLFS